MKIADLLTSLGVQVKASGHEHCRPGWVQLDCPHCTRGQHHWRLGLNLRGNYLNCWSCGPLRFYDTIKELTGRSYGELKKLLSDIEPTERDKVIQLRGKLEYPDYLEPLLPAHKRYLQGRGFDLAELKKLWGIDQGIGIGPDLAWRVFIPVYYKQEVVSWTTRSIDEKAKPRYLGARPKQEKINAKSLLYGEDYCRGSIVVVEGPTDVWKIGPGSAATLGTGFNQAQVARIARYPVRAVCFDAVPDAQKVAKELCRSLSVFSGETYNLILDAKDAGSASMDEIQSIRKRFL